MQLTMFVGNNRHYTIESIRGRHFVQTAKRAGLPEAIARDVLQELGEMAPPAIRTVQAHLPREFPAVILDSVSRALLSSLDRLAK